MTRLPVAAVITTIQEPTASVHRLDEAIAAVGGRMIVVGDKKGPARFDLPTARFLPLGEQLSLEFALARLLPTGHYARKNLGYLMAMTLSPDCIYETDDDNAPADGWRTRPRRVTATTVAPRPWLNAFRLFSDLNIWPRGFPLDEVKGSDVSLGRIGPEATVDAPIQQDLADGEPDVDAIWRLTMTTSEVTFTPGPSVMLPRDTWCPFNSQSTWWWSPAYPLLYLPSFCSFRMTDIWRGFIAQRCLWELGLGLVFHAPQVVQERNMHDLMRDFSDELPGYQGNRRFADVLTALVLRPGPANVISNMRSCYRALVQAGFFPEKELELVDAWLSDLERVPSLA
jgi:hypothetical protein